jgi:hypothetical protein
MIRLPVVLSLLLASPAVAGGPAWDDFVADKTPSVRILGAVGACANAVSDPPRVAAVLRDAGWDQADADDGTLGFQVDNTALMFWETPDFCMVETSDFSTAALTAVLGAFDIRPDGRDDAGCAQFTIDATTATLTGGGNDPTCTSETEAALRFEVTQ